jgi:hypothetical protein
MPPKAKRAPPKPRSGRPPPGSKRRAAQAGPGAGNPPKRRRGNPNEGTEDEPQNPNNLTDPNDSDDSNRSHVSPTNGEEHNNIVAAFQSVNERMDRMVEQSQNLETFVQDRITELTDLVLQSRQIQQQPTARTEFAQSAGLLPLSGNIPTPADITTQWQWVERALVQSIAGGEFDIFSLPKLHRDDSVRRKHTNGSIEGILLPSSGSRPEILSGVGRLHNHFSNIGSFYSA